MRGRVGVGVGGRLRAMEVDLIGLNNTTCWRNGKWKWLTHFPRREMWGRGRKGLVESIFMTQLNVCVCREGEREVSV